MTRSTLTLVLSAFTAFTALFGVQSSTAQPPQFITNNAGFEDPIDFNSWTIDRAFSGSYLTCVTDASQAHSGQRFAQFGAHEGLYDSLSKHFETVPGLTYRISFFLASDNVAPNYDSFLVTWNGVPVFDLSSPQNGFPYSRQAVDVVATSSSSEIAFMGYKRFGSFRLDDVGVTYAPASDFCSDAPRIRAGTWYGDLFSATNDSASACGFVLARDVWYRYTPSCDATVSIDTCGSDFDSVVSVFSGTCGVLSEVVCDNNSAGCGGLSALITPTLSAGQTYYIRIAGFSAFNVGNYVLNVVEPGPANAVCQNAQPVSPGETYFANLFCAGTEQQASCAPSANDIWYVYTPACDHDLSVNTCGSAIDTVLSVYDGNCGSFSEIACNDDQNGQICDPNELRASALSVPVIGGQSYYIRIASFNVSLPGPIVLNVGAVAVNNRCDTARDIENGSIDFDARCATPNSGNPGSCGTFATPSLWFSYTATCTGATTIEICSSAPIVDAVVRVFTPDCNEPTCVNQAQVKTLLPCPQNIPALSFYATANQQYLLCYSQDIDAIPGAGTLSVRPTPPSPNDDCDNATPAALGVTSGVFSCATQDQTSSCAGVTDVWHRFTPSLAGRYRLSTCDSEFDTTLSVFQGACGALSEIVCNDDAQAGCPAAPTRSSVFADLAAGVTYLIRVGSYFGQPGAYSLNIVFPPVNDTCERATPVTPGNSYPGTTVNAGADTATPCGQAVPSPDVWYSYTPAAEEIIVLDTCSPAILDTVVSVYAGSCDALQHLVCNDNAGPLGPCPNSTRSFVTLTLQPGVTYLIQVTSPGGSAGPFTLNISRFVANDTCTTAQHVFGSSVLTGSTADATPDTSASCGSGPSNDVWYRWNSGCAPRLILDTCDSEFDTVLSVYEGSCGGLTEIACNNNDSGNEGCAPGASRLDIPVAPFTDYFIRLGGVGGVSGDYALDLIEGPRNNACALATPVHSGVTTFDGRCGAIDASGTLVECDRPNQATLWYTYVAPCTGSIIVNLCGSNYNTIVSAHEGACGKLVELACNDDAGAARCPGNPFNSRIRFDAIAGVIYTLRVTSFDDELSTGMMDISCRVPPSCVGDANIDGFVNLPDLAIVNAHFGLQSGATWQDGDFTFDGIVDIEDLSLLLARFGGACE